jgi:hypothetical protein
VGSAACKKKKDPPTNSAGLYSGASLRLFISRPNQVAKIILEAAGAAGR